MPILIQYNIHHPKIETRSLGTLARQVIRETLITVNGPEDAEISLLFTGDNEMLELNEKYRHISRPTDVLSFAFTEGSGPPPPTPMLGDIVISLDTAIRQSQDRGHSVRREITILLIHGILHLLGYDHENVSKTKRDQMRAAERAALQHLQDNLIV